MRSRVAPVCLCALLCAPVAPAFAGECPDNPDALGVARVLELDTRSGPRVGTLQYGRTLALGPKEVVLTFDDGPHGHTTDRILAALGKECVKATFFAVGVWAKRYPEQLRKIATQGHTLGAHSWSHPLNLSRLSAKAAQLQIEKGFAAIKAAIGKSVAPFFRFPGLNDSSTLKTFTAQRGYAVFSTDISSDDWLGIGSTTIVRRTMARLRRQGRGILLFHDTKWTTAAAIPLLLRALKEEGYNVVHVVPKGAQPFNKPEVAKAEPLEGARTVAVSVRPTGPD